MCLTSFTNKILQLLKLGIIIIIQKINFLWWKDLFDQRVKAIQDGLKKSAAEADKHLTAALASSPGSLSGARGKESLGTMCPKQELNNLLVRNIL